MARTHKGGGPPRQSQSAASGQLPSSASAGGAAGAGPSLSSAQRSPLKPDSTSSSLATGKQAEPPRGGRQTVVLDAAMIRALVGDDSSGRGRQGSSSKAAEVEHLGFKCSSPLCQPGSRLSRAPRLTPPSLTRLQTSSSPHLSPIRSQGPSLCRRRRPLSTANTPSSISRGPTRPRSTAL